MDIAEIRKKAKAQTKPNDLSLESTGQLEPETEPFEVQGEARGMRPPGF